MEPTANSSRNAEARKPLNHSSPTAVPPVTSKPRPGANATAGDAGCNALYRARGLHPYREEPITGYRLASLANGDADARVELRSERYRVVAQDAIDEAPLTGHSGISEASEQLPLWENNGTPYRVMLRPPAPVQAPEPSSETAGAGMTMAVAAQPQGSIPAASDALVPASTPFRAPAKPLLNRTLIGGALLAATTIALWKPWTTETDVGAPVEAEASPSAPLPTEPPSLGATVPVVDQEAPPAQDAAGNGQPAVEISRLSPEDSTSQPAEQDFSAGAQPPAAREPTQPEGLPVPTPEQPSLQAKPESPVPSQTRTAASSATTRRANASNAQRKASSLPSAATGTLTVAISPWGEVWIDGRKRGISPPLLKLQLPPGTYRIEFRNPGLPSHEQTLQVTAGQSATLRHSFQ